MNGRNLHKYFPEILKTINIYYFSYFIILSLFLYLLISPIQFLLNHDLGYHLNAGRFFFETGNLPDSAFFSYIEPEKTWINYFWGFQVVSYAIYSLFGYSGLIFFKALLVGLSALIISKIIIAHKKDKDYASCFWQIAIFALIAFLLSYRGNMIRPHLISYFLIPLFIYVLFYKKRFIPLLPFLTIFWVNTHGVEWPVGALICGSFIIENYLKNRTQKSKQLDREMYWVLACIPAMFINPNGAKIFLAPFATPKEIYSFIAELQPTYEHLMAVFFNANDFFFSLAIFLLLFFSLFAFINLVRSRKLEIYQLLLAAGGIFLLLKGNRFISEWLLLTLPLLRSANQNYFSGEFNNKGKSIFIVLSLWLIFYPLYKWFDTQRYFSHYPISYSSMPAGTMSFIKSLPLVGRLHINPGLGGFAQWELGNKFTIHSDMEFPPFDGMDYFEANSVFFDANALNKFMERYQPDYICVDKDSRFFTSFSSEIMGLTPIFFEDRFVLYINSNKHPEIARLNEIKYLDLSEPLAGGDTNLGQRIDELLKLSKHHKYAAETLLVLSRLLKKADRIDESLQYSLKAIWASPFNSKYYNEAGLIYLKRGNYAAAIDYFESALKYSQGNDIYISNNRIAETYYFLKDYPMAYKYFEKGMRLFLKREVFEYYYEYAFSALSVGDVDKAENLCRMILILDDGEHDDIIVRAKEILIKINAAKAG